MPYQSSNPRRRKKRKQQNSSSLLVLILVCLMILLIGMAVALRMMSGSSAPKEPAKETTVQTEAPETEPPEPTEEQKESFWSRLFGKKKSEEPVETTAPVPEHQIASATIAATGDILMHKPVFNSCQVGNGEYNFDRIFRYLAPYVQQADYSAANLETTLCGADNGYPYNGYPAFNCPDEIVDGLKNAGFDMLLTANNHCYDTSEFGFLRTVRTVRQKGLTALGTMESSNDPKYVIQDLNGIRIGMLCYTYEGQPENPQPGIVYMNQNAMTPGSELLINSFLATNPEPFYQELTGYIRDMRNDGAEAIVLYIHWGEEYQTIPSGEQRNMAQRLCDLGVDVIIGGHPHVIQPVDMLTSKNDPEHRTLVLYSMGNAVSNQRISEMNLKTGHTEDGLLFTVTFSKYSDGTVYLDGADILPTWVDLRIGFTAEYDIIPLDNSIRSSWKEEFGLSDAAFENAVSSYDRTWEIVGGGLSRAQRTLSERKEQREADYLAAVALPDAA